MRDVTAARYGVRDKVVSRLVALDWAAGKGQQRVMRLATAATPAYRPSMNGSAAKSRCWRHADSELVESLRAVPCEAVRGPFRAFERTQRRMGIRNSATRAGRPMLLHGWYGHRAGRKNSREVQLLQGHRVWPNPPVAGHAGNHWLRAWEIAMRPFNWQFRFFTQADRRATTVLQVRNAPGKIRAHDGGPSMKPAPACSGWNFCASPSMPGRAVIDQFGLVIPSSSSMLSIRMRRFSSLTSP